ncbi:hypothetical protein E1B28_005115 [Marasmius oreades]|uniref:DNA-directed RNA polymerase n=1 Tax=Marasmius oreades TaxID=181124 RepID=A0A9P8ADH7_9AGAR|nr:uncharacterized protein E1B28_005115 [Marasmius oreades]KAG7097796.1 hypothetical protein E1B28_005115 [Marasmius oreades]
MGLNEVEPVRKADARHVRLSVDQGRIPLHAKGYSRSKQVWFVNPLDFQRVETHKEFNLALAVKRQTITNGLKYSLATGNSGDQKKSRSSKAGVSQVLNRTLMRLHRPISIGVILLLVVKERSPSHVSYTIPIGEWSALQRYPKGRPVGWPRISLLCPASLLGPTLHPSSSFWRSGNRGRERTPNHAIHEGTTPCTKVFVNGVWMGVHHDPANLVKKLRRKDDIFETSEKENCDCIPMRVGFADLCSSWQTSNSYSRRNTSGGSPTAKTMKDLSISGSTL